MMQEGNTGSSAHTFVTNPPIAIRLAIVAGARPNFMKIAPLFHVLTKESWCRPIIVHTGQHYDAEMSEAFFRDHQAYTEKDIRELLELRQRSDAGGFVTTEKDAVKLGGFMDSLEPLSVVPVKMELTDAANVVDTILRVIEGRRRRS